jgi:hypothetical protein
MHAFDGVGEEMKKRQTTKIELRPDGWDRFTRAVDAAVKSGPKHRPSKKTPASRKRVGGEKPRA